MPPNRRVLLASVLLAGCATGVPVEHDTVVQGGGFTNVSGEARFVVRTVLAAESGNERQEVVGARCTALSSLYKAEFRSPTRLVVPNFGPQSPEITVSCTTEKLAGTATAKLVTRWDGPPGYPGPMWGPGWAPGWGPPWGPAWGAWGWPGPAFPVSDYPDLVVTLR